MPAMPAQTPSCSIIFAPRNVLGGKFEDVEPRSLEAQLFQFGLSCIENRAVAAGVDLRKDRPGPCIGQIDRDYEAFGKRHVGLGVLRLNHGNAFAASVLAQKVCLVE